jgi:hypothetical protein
LKTTTLGEPPSKVRAEPGSLTLGPRHCQWKFLGRVTVHWPSGRRQEFRELQGRQWWRLHEGKEPPERVAERLLRARRLDGPGAL